MITQEKILWSLNKFSQLILCMWILGLKELSSVHYSVRDTRKHDFAHLCWFVLAT